jgi:hypothetical protein
MHALKGGILGELQPVATARARESLQHLTALVHAWPVHGPLPAGSARDKLICKA